MPLTRRVKMMMLAESTTSAITILFVARSGREHPPLTQMAARAEEPMKFDASRSAAVCGAPGRPRRPAICITQLADAGPPAGAWEWSFCSRSWREQ